MLPESWEKNGKVKEQKEKENLTYNLKLKYDRVFCLTPSWPLSPLLFSYKRYLLIPLVAPSLIPPATWRTIGNHSSASGRHFNYFPLIPREGRHTQLLACLAVMSGRTSFVSSCISHVENLQRFAFTLCICGRLKWFLRFLFPRLALVLCSFKCSRFRIVTHLFNFWQEVPKTPVNSEPKISQQTESCYCKITCKNLRVAMCNPLCYPPTAICKSLSRSGW
jgi:hypothetical protein